MSSNLLRFDQYIGLSRTGFWGFQTVWCFKFKCTVYFANETVQFNSGSHREPFGFHYRPGIGLLAESYIRNPVQGYSVTSVAQRQKRKKEYVLVFEKVFFFPMLYLEGIFPPFLQILNK